jgi:hypothetical protein
MSTLGGTRTRSLRVEGPASSPLRPRGHARLRWQGSNLRFAGNNRVSSQLDHTGLGQAEAAGLEPASGGGRLRDSNALPFQLGHASLRRKERDSNPQGPKGPPVFGTGYRADGSPSARGGPGRRRPCTLPAKSRELYGHLNGRSRARTGGLLIRVALCQLSYPPSTTLVCPAPAGELDAHPVARTRFGHVSGRWPLRQRSCSRHSPTLRPWIAGAGAASYVEGCWSPVLAWYHCKSAGKSNTYIHTRNQRYSVEDLSLSGGASRETRTFQAEHHLLVGSSLICLQKQRRRPIGSPLPAVVSTLELASTPRGKGETAAVLAPQIGAMPARLDRRRRRWFEKEVRCVAEV